MRKKCTKSYAGINYSKKTTPPPKKNQQDKDKKL